MALAVLSAAHCSLALSLSPQTLPRHARAARAEFANNGGLLYHRSFLPPAVFEDVQAECRRLRGSSKREKDSIAVGRLGRILDSRTASHKALMSDACTARLAELTGLEALRSSDYAVEFRYYPVGAAMDWHRDDQLFVPAQLEVVFTLENTSDSETQWLTPCGLKESVWTEPNSIIAVTAGDAGPVHRVTPIRRGDRSILKLVYSRSEERTANYADHLDSFPGRRQKRGQKHRARRHARNR